MLNLPLISNLLLANLSRVNLPPFNLRRPSQRQRLLPECNLRSN
jgi:hypothetical protein